MRRLRNPNLLRSWLIGILINVWREWARSKENAQYSRDSLGETDGGSRFFRPVHDREASEDPALLFQNKELRRVIRESVLGLPAKLRMPALMFYFDGMSVRESAAALGVSEDALKMRLSRARARLRSHLA
jgi:RNA polymerase sigma-70 factor (ECF subfamily)